MQCELVMIGTELLLGQIVDTNAVFMAQTLAENGISLQRKTTVGDNPARIRDVLESALQRSGVILISGGLGPTEDDITRECVAEVLGRPLEYRAELYDDLVARFAHLRLNITENNRKQANAPRGATAIDNPNGTAPGLIVDDERGIVICMPGVPSELKPMLTDRVIPYLRQRFDLPGVIHSRVLKVCGVGESRVDTAIGDLIVSQSNPTIGLLASPEAVRIRITARAKDVEKANTLIDEVDARVRERLPGLIMGTNDATIETVVDALLRERGWTLALGESHTGGIIAQRLTAAHAQSFLGALVDPAAHDGGPAAAARDAAQEARERYGADCGLGLAPDDEANCSAVHFVSPDGNETWQLGRLGSGHRGQVRTATVTLERIRRHLCGVQPPPEFRTWQRDAEDKRD